MSITEVASEAEVTGEVLDVLISKIKGAIKVETGKIENLDYTRVFMEGLKVVLAKGLGKVTKTTHPDEDARAAAATEIVEANLQALYDGTYKWGRQTGAGKSKVPGEVMKIARDMARADVKTALKAKGKKLSAIKSAVITKLANDAIASDPSYVAEATKAYEAQKAKTIRIDVSNVKEDPDLLNAIETRKKAAKSQLSAAQAGRTGRRGENRPRV